MNQDPNNLVSTETTPPVIAPIVTPEEEQTYEEPVMITANIDDMPVDQIPQSILSEEQVPQANEVVEPTEDVQGPELGQTQVDEEKVPTFQQLTVENEEGYVAEAKQQTDLTVEPTIPETYQAGHQNIMEQSMPETTPTEDVEEEEEEQPKKKRSKLLLVIIIVLVILLVAGAFLFKGNFRKAKATINQKTIGDINIAVVGDVNSTKDALYLKLTGEENQEYKCEEETSLDVTYSIMKNELDTSKQKYNLRYPCGYADFLKYVILNNDLEKIDGAILVVKASDGIQPQTIVVAEALKKIGIEKMIVFISQSTNPEENKNAKADVNDLLDAKGFDKTTTPIITGSIDKEADIKKLLTEADSWFENTKVETDSYVIQDHKKIKMYTYVKTTSEGGESTPMQNNDQYTFEIGNKVKGKVILPDGLKQINPGDNVDVTVELEEKVSLEKGMKVPFYKDSKVVAIGVIDEIIE